MRFTLKESQKRLAIKKVNAIKRRVGIYLKESSLTNWRFSVCWQMVSMIEELTGRAGKTETRKRYAKGYRVQTLYEECILKLDYELDLSGLRVSDLISE